MHRDVKPDNTRHNLSVTVPAPPGVPFKDGPFSGQLVSVEVVVPLASAAPEDVTRAAQGALTLARPFVAPRVQDHRCPGIGCYACGQWFATQAPPLTDDQRQRDEERRRRLAKDLAEEREDRRLDETAYGGFWARSDADDADGE